MSYLEGKGFSDFSKAVFSLWFRVPQASIDAAHAAWVTGTPELNVSNGGDLGPWALLGIVPLITFGPSGLQAMSKTVDTHRFIGTYLAHDMTPDVFHGRTGELPWIEIPNEVTPEGLSEGPSPWPVEVYVGDIVSTGTLLTSPSVIGVFCGKKKPELCFRFETGEYPDVLEGYTLSPTSVSGDFYTYELINWYVDPSPGGNPSWAAAPPVGITPSLEEMAGKGFYTGTLDKTNYTYEDVSRITSNITAAYSNGTNLDDSAPCMPVTADAWHHVLISVDLSDPCIVSGGGVISAPRVWAALDDVNYTGEALSAFSTGGNRVLSPQAFSSLGHHDPAQTYSSSAGAKAVGLAIGVPATSRYTKVIRKVQMAELQIFTGVSLDTGVAKNRRAFINSKGQPVDEAYSIAKFRGVYGPESPNVGPSSPVRLLGKRPDISLTRAAGNWMGGINLGTVKTELKPIGKILPVSPDPVLGK